MAACCLWCVFAKNICEISPGRKIVDNVYSRLQATEYKKKVAGARARRARRASAKFEEESEAGGIVAQERKLRVSGNNE